MKVQILCLFFFLITPTFESKIPELTNVKMVEIYGKVNRGSPQRSVPGNKESCLEDCKSSAICMGVEIETGRCTPFSTPKLQEIGRLKKSENKVFYVKVNANVRIDDCENPMYDDGFQTSFVSNTSKFLKTEILKKSNNWRITYKEWKCLTDFPKQCKKIGNIHKKSYIFNLNSTFSTGETFFMKGRTSENATHGFSLSFYDEKSQNFPLYIILKNNNPKIEFATWRFYSEKMDNTQYAENPLKPNEAFEFRINATEKEAFIYLNDNLQYTFQLLLPGFPLSTVTQFAVNIDMYEYQSVYLDFVGWSGICGFE